MDSVSSVGELNAAPQVAGALETCPVLPGTRKSHLVIRADL